MRAAFVLAGCVFLFVVLSIARRSSPTFPVADEAVIELSTLNALEGRQLLGPYSRYGWYHPGPALYYVLAPFYGSSGRRAVGLAAGALTLNLAVLAAMVWMLFRYGGPVLAVTFALFSAVFLGRLNELLISSWNAHAAILAAAAVIVASAATAAGSLGVIPLCVVLASFALQTHIVTLPLVAIAIGVLVVGAIRNGPDQAATLRRAVNRTFGSVLLLWMLPLVEQVMPHGGNLTQMWRFAGAPSANVTPAVAFDAWADMLSAPLRSGLALPRGVTLPYRAAAFAAIAAIGETLLLMAVAWWAHRNRRRFHMWIAVELFLVSLAALWAVARIPDNVQDHQVFWIAAVGLLNIVAIVAVPIGMISRHNGQKWYRGQKWDPALAGLPVTGLRLAAAICVVLIAAMAVSGVRELRRVADRSRAMTRGDIRTDHATRAVEAEIARTGSRRPKVLIDVRAWETAAGVILQLRRKGMTLAVEPGLERMLSGTAAADGTEDLEITFCGGPCHERLTARPDNTVVLFGDGLAIDAIALKP